MTFIGLSEGTKGYIFIRSPNNIVFTAIQALFDKMLFPKCPNMRRPGYTPVGLTPGDLQGEHNGPPDDGGGLPPIPYHPAAPQGPENVQLVSTLPLDLTLWHRWLGHLNHDSIKKMLNHDLVTGLTLNSWANLILSVNPA